MADIDAVEKLLCERYNVRSLDGLGALPHAIEAAREGDLTPLREALTGRELYRWAEPIKAALTDAPATPEPASEQQPTADSDAAPAEEGDGIEVALGESAEITGDGSGEALPEASNEEREAPPESTPRRRGRN